MATFPRNQCSRGSVIGVPQRATLLRQHSLRERSSLTCSVGSSWSEARDIGRTGVAQGMRAAMYRNLHQEAFSRAYIRAVVAAAGFKYSDGSPPDDDHVDVTVISHGPMGFIRSPRLDIQVKCKLGSPEGDPISYALDVDDYEGLRHLDYGSPRIMARVGRKEAL